MPERTRLLNMGADSSTPLIRHGLHSPSAARLPFPARMTRGASPVRSTTVVGTIPHEPQSSTRSTACSSAARMSRASFSGSSAPGSSSVEDRTGSLKLREQGLHDTVIGNAHAYGLAARMLQPFRHFARRAQYEGVAAVRRRLEQPELPVVHARVLADLREIAADEREMVARDRPAGSRGCAPRRTCRPGWQPSA